jgi:hypothetical protein
VTAIGSFRRLAELRNTRRWTFALLLAAITVPAAGVMLDIGTRVIKICYLHTALKLPGGGRDVPITRFGTSDAALKPVGTSVAALDRVGPRLDPAGDTLVLVSRAAEADRGVLFAQLVYLFAPRSVAEVRCSGEGRSGLVAFPKRDLRIAGVIYQSTPPPADVPPHQTLLLGSHPTDGRPIVFAPMTLHAPESFDWTQFCR